MGVRCAALRAVAAAAAPILTAEEVLKAIKSFPEGSAGGKSGLKPQHLKDTLVPGYGDECVRALTEVVALLASGKAHPAARQWICCASLTALGKPDGGLRPIAIGETLRRLTSKTLVKEAGEDFLSYFEPIQVGVGSKGGAEAAIHAVRQFLGRRRGKSAEVVALLDLKNAFSCVDRSAFREAIRRVAPRLAPWVDFQYGEASPLFFGEFSLWSERGVQQGEPLGPALFAAAIHPIILRMDAHLRDLGLPELGLRVFYLDDGVLAGAQESVAAAINFLEVELGEIGLSMNRSKCELVPVAGRDHAVDPTIFAGFEFRESGDSGY